MERLYTDEDKSHVLQLFVNITDLVPQHIGQVIRLLKVNPYIYLLCLFESNKRQNGKPDHAHCSNDLYVFNLNF